MRRQVSPQDWIRTPLSLPCVTGLRDCATLLVLDVLLGRRRLRLGAGSASDQQRQQQQ